MEQEQGMDRSLDFADSLTLEEALEGLSEAEYKELEKYEKMIADHADTLEYCKKFPYNLHYAEINDYMYEFTDYTRYPDEWNTKSVNKHVKSENQVRARGVLVKSDTRRIHHLLKASFETLHLAVQKASKAKTINDKRGDADLLLAETRTFLVKLKTLMEDCDDLIDHIDKTATSHRTVSDNIRTASKPEVEV